MLHAKPTATAIVRGSLASAWRAPNPPGWLCPRASVDDDVRGNWMEHACKQVETAETGWHEAMSQFGCESAEAMAAWIVYSRTRCQGFADQQRRNLAQAA